MMPTNPGDILAKVVDAQAEHPVYPRLRIEMGAEAGRVRVVVGERVLEMGPDQALQMLEGRQRAIRLESEDPFGHGYEPPFWAEVDWAVAELVCRPENADAVLEVLILGGNRAGKTDYAAKRFMECLALNDNWLCWAFHSDQAASRSVQQRRSWHYMPLAHKPERGKLRKDVRQRMNYNQESGFTENMFSLGNGSAAHYKFYSADVKALEGDEPNVCWSDEEIPEEWVQAIGVRLLTKAGKRGAVVAELRSHLERRAREPGHALPRLVRARMWHGVHLITFTPISGLTPTVRRFVQGATPTVTVPAELLPVRDADGQVMRHEHVPRMARCQDPTRLAVWFHTYDNVHGGNYRGMVAACRGKTPSWVKIRVYGVTAAAKEGRFPQFSRSVHVRPHGPLPEGTWYHVADPCNGRNFFMIWALVTPLGQVLVAREWPQPEDYVEGVGPMGDWAVLSGGKRMDGDRGPAQQSLGWGIKRYVAEIERVERELHRRQRGKEAEAGRIDVFTRIIDSRAGNTPTLAASETLTLIDLLANEGLEFEPAGMLVAAEGQPRRNTINEGIDLLNDWLAHEGGADGDPLAGPKLFISERCQNTIFALENWTGQDGPEGACKDPIDVLRYLRIHDPIHLEAGAMETRGGGCY